MSALQPRDGAAPMPAPWLSVVGIGEEGLAGVGPAGRSLIDAAEVLVGGARHLAMVPEDGRPRLPWPSPLSALVEEIALRRRGQRVCVLASGDPLCYGVGTTLARHVPLAEITIVPAPSAFSLACARLGWSLPDVETLTLHGRPVELLHPFVYPGARILVLSAGAATPAEVAALLRARGYGDSRLTVLEHMGGGAERRREGRAADWDGAVAELNTLAIDCVAGPEAAPLPRVPGLPDEAFHHDGQLTKREVRAATLAALAPLPGQLLWDVGAGCGSIAIEWIRSHPRCRALAVEREPDRRVLIAANAAALGAPKLEIVAGAAPAALADLEAPDAVFVGGGLGRGDDGLFETCWPRLKPGGRLVANVVTLEGEARLLALHREHGGELLRLAVSRAGPVGPLHGWRPLMTVTQWRLTKPAEVGA